MNATPAAAGAARFRLIVAFAAIYLVWGSSYLAIRIAIESIPPFLMAGSRFFIAGLLLYGWTLARGVPPPTLREWRGALVVGGLLLLGGNGGVSWAEQRVASGPAALMVALVPLWMVLFDGWRPGGSRPGRQVMAGVMLGLAGLALLTGPSRLVGAGRLDPVGAAVLVFATVSWATGSLVARQVRLPASPARATAMQMLAGGALLLAAGLATGETARLDPGAVTARSAGAVAYLVVVASIVAFTAYGWLLRVSTPARVATYAYVNPVVALLLGWAFAGETLTPRTVLAAGVIFGAVVIITGYPPRAPAPPAAAGGVAAGRPEAGSQAARGIERARCHLPRRREDDRDARRPARGIGRAPDAPAPLGRPGARVAREGGGHVLDRRPIGALVAGPDRTVVRAPRPRRPAPSPDRPVRRARCGSARRSRGHPGASVPAPVKRWG